MTFTLNLGTQMHRTQTALNIPAYLSPRHRLWGLVLFNHWVFRKTAVDTTVAPLSLGTLWGNT